MECCDKYPDEKQPREESVYLAYEFITVRELKQELRVSHPQSRGERENVQTGLLDHFLICLASSLPSYSYELCLGNVPPTVGCVFWYQIIIQTVSLRQANLIERMPHYTLWPGHSTLCQVDNYNSPVRETAPWDAPCKPYLQCHHSRVLSTAWTSQERLHCGGITQAKESCLT